MAEAATLKVVLTDAGQPGGAPGVPAPGVTMPGAAGRAPVPVAGVRPAAVTTGAPAQAVGMFRAFASQLVSATGLGEVVRNLKASAVGLVATASSLRALTVAGAPARGAGLGVVAGVGASMLALGAAAAAAGFALRRFTDVASGMAQRLARWVPALGITEAFARLRAIQRERFEAAQLAPALIRFVQRREELADRLVVLLTPIKERLIDLLTKILEKTTRLVELFANPDLLMKKAALELYALIGPLLADIASKVGLGVAGWTREDVDAWVADQRAFLDRMLKSRLDEQAEKLKKLGVDNNLEVFMNMLAPHDLRNIRDPGIQFGAFDVGQ